MTCGKRWFAAVSAVICCVGCSANRTQMTTQIHRPLRQADALGKYVAVLSVVSAEKSKPWHAKQATEARKAIQDSLEKNNSVHVVKSQALPPRYGDERNCTDIATLVQQACENAAGQPIDTICLVQLKDGLGQLTLGLAIPPQQLVSVRGTCDYDLRLIDVCTGEELFCATGTWSEHTDTPMWPRMPSAAHFGEQLAELVRAGAPSASYDVASQPATPVPLVATSKRD